MASIAHKTGYKHQLQEDSVTATDIKPATPLNTKYIQCGTDGTLAIEEGYAWDGSSGLTIDTLNFMRGSLVPDALCQLMRERCLAHDT